MILLIHTPYLAYFMFCCAVLCLCLNGVLTPPPPSLPPFTYKYIEFSCSCANYGRLNLTTQIPYNPRTSS